jgi:hypothetical protein
MLTDRERELWEDIERRYAAEFARPAGMDPSALLIVGARVTIVLILLGAVAAGLVVGVATGVGGLLRRYGFDRSADTASCSAWARRRRAISCSSSRIRLRYRSGRPRS